jgi:hypothetical protein
MFFPPAATHTIQENLGEYSRRIFAGFESRFEPRSDYVQAVGSSGASGGKQEAQQGA